MFAAARDALAMFRKLKADVMPQGTEGRSTSCAEVNELIGMKERHTLAELFEGGSEGNWPIHSGRPDGLNLGY